MAQQRPTYSITNGLWPLHGDAEHGPTCVRLALDFTTVASQSIDLTEDEFMSALKFAQTLYVDNADNAAALTIIMQITQQRIKVKANTQGYYPALVQDKSQFTFSVPAPAAVIVPIYFINVPLPAIQWATV